ncbi:MAG TPA: 2-succinyl-6-hydroxy-2,4-cyclohexadiene-1-carboxylate synthase [Opitutales bacterium]|nr:2-succinyl-6-hydroxy-2,4-cyclohexadiene-1-carboxylate synthase [Opitutales bacterium]
MFSTTPVQIEGQTWCVHEYGPKDGLPILALHGFAGLGEDFLPIIEQSPKSWRWILPDLIGHGQSAGPDELNFYRLDYLMRSLFQIQDQFLNGQNYVLLGYSLGGRIALQYAINHPQQIAQLVLISASPGIRGEEARVQRRNEDEVLAQFLMTHGMDEFVRLWENRPIIASQRKHIPAATFAHMRIRRLENKPRALAHALSCFSPGLWPECWGRAAYLKMPVLIVTGEEDTVYSHNAEEMCRRIPQSKHLTIPKAGHAVHLENTTAFVAALEPEVNAVTECMVI